MTRTLAVLSGELIIWLILISSNNSGAKKQNIISKMEEEDLLILIEEKALEIDILRSEFEEFQCDSKEYEAELELEVTGKEK